jgi:hypothetical protein
MVATVSKQTIIDGSRNLVVNVHIDGDAAGDLTDYVLIDASTYTPAFTNCRFWSLHATLSGFTCHLKWDATTDTELVNVPDYEINFSPDEIGEFGGIPNNAGAGRTGDILMTTVGLGAGDHGSLILHLIKKD